MSCTGKVRRMCLYVSVALAELPATYNEEIALVLNCGISGAADGNSRGQSEWRKLY